MRLTYTCPKRKCRHVWEAHHPRVEDGTCPKCGASRLVPVDIEKGDQP